MTVSAAVPVSWWRALDPPIYLISVLPGIAVWLLSGSIVPVPGPFAIATLAVLLLQHAINVLNDVSDWRLGADIEKTASWAHYHRLNLSRASAHGYASLVAGGMLGLYSLFQAQRLEILWVAAPLVLLGYLYNSGPRPLSYTHFGEWVTGLCYGPGVFGCLWILATGRVSLPAVIGSVAFCALAVALLLSHQPPQIDTDRRAGKLSFAVRFGAARTYQTARLLYLGFLLMFCAAVIVTQDSTAVATAVVLSTLLAGIFAIIYTPSPRRLLSGAAAVILVTLLARCLHACEVGMR